MAYKAASPARQGNTAAIHRFKAKIKIVLFTLLDAVSILCGLTKSFLSFLSERTKEEGRKKKTEAKN